MKFTAVLAGTAVVATAAAPPADAAERGLRFNAGAASEYVFRGVSQTDEDPQAFAGADLTRGNGYAGVWASNVDYRDGTDAEIDLYGGFRPVVADWTLDLGVVAYLYPGQPDGADYDYVEGKLGASRDFGRATLGATVWWSPDFFGREEEATYVEATVGYRPADAWTVSAAAGRQSVSSDADYAAWNLGATWAAGDAVTLDLRWYDTDAHDLGSAYDSRFVLVVKAVY